MPDKTSQNLPIKIRAHHLLCFHGFSGRGYDDQFIQNMTALKELFLSNPETSIMIISGPDDVCLYCPHLVNNDCTKGDDPLEDRKTKELDHRVMKHTGLNEGQLIAVKTAFEIVEEAITPSIFESLCADCEWFELGHCAEGISTGFYSQE